LIVLATVLAVGGGVVLYVRQELVNRGAFADRATAALRADPVRRVVATELVVQVIDRGSTDVISARPLLQSVVEFLVSAPPFQPVVRIAADHAHRLLFARQGGNAAFDVADAGTVVASALRSVAPNLAREIPKNTDATLLELRKRNFAAETLRVADSVRTWGVVLPILALCLLALAIAAAGDRRSAVTRIGVSLGVASAALVITLELLKAYVVAHVYGSDELTNAEVRAAVGAVWDAYLGDLGSWALAAGAISLLVAAASASLLRPFDAGSRVERVGALLRAPASPRWRALRGASVLLLGMFLILSPTLTLQALAVVVGAVIVYYGAGELLAATYTPDRRRSRLLSAARGGNRFLILAAAAGLAAVASGVLVLALGGHARSARAQPATTCNGYVQLCDRRLDQVVFAGTHNSMSAADSRGWYIANQRRTIARQLSDGIRFLKISPHYGTQGSAGYVRTNFTAEDHDLNRVTKQLSPAAVVALQRLGRALGLGAETGAQDIWLCHTVCELGATRMLDALVTVREFLLRNPGNVVFLLLESFVKESDVVRVFERAGLLPFLATLDRLKPLPTLRELIDSGRKVIVLNEHPVSGRQPWNMYAWDWIQDTPLKAKRPSEFSCARSRGTPDSPLLMINNWADGFPPLLSANRAILNRRFIAGRARQCMRARRMLPNIISSDFYDQGHLVEVVRQLNGLGNEPPAPTS
jgi:hypothetical protein